MYTFVVMLCSVSAISLSALFRQIQTTGQEMNRHMVHLRPTQLFQLYVQRYCIQYKDCISQKCPRKGDHMQANTHGYTDLQGANDVHLLKFVWDWPGTHHIVQWVFRLSEPEELEVFVQNRARLYGQHQNVNNHNM